MKYTILFLSTIILGSCGRQESPGILSSDRATETEQKNAPAYTGYTNKLKRADNSESDYSANGAAAFDAKGNSFAPNENLIADRKMIWNANLKFRVESMDRSTEAIRLLCKSHQAYISDMKREQNDYQLATHITIRVANNHFHDLVAAIKGESEHLDIATITSEDVTEEFVDIENRLATKRKARERYIEILRSKTGSIEEIIQAEEAIRRITEEIEAKEGRLRFLSDQMEFSTITLHIYKPIEEAKPQIAEADSYGDQVSASFSAGWNVIKGLGLLLVAIWPLFLILAMFLFWKRKWFMRTFFRTGAAG
ncbi:MAG: DUF4349 domain-containing protein [Crocinitomicaceae bacterium]